MIDYAELNDPTLIERIICRKIKQLKPVPMDEDLSEIFFGIGMMKTLNMPVSDENQPKLYKILEERLGDFTFEIKDPYLILFMCAVCRTPAIVMMFLWYIQYWSFENQIKEIDFGVFADKIFPDGFFEDSDLKSIWYSQKVWNKPHTGMSDNLVDYPQAGASVQFIH